jgi:transcriptional antiterminator
MTESLKNAFPKTFHVASEMAKMIEENYMIILPDGEIGYLTMHIENIILQQKG